MGLFERIKVLSLEQATVAPYLTYRLAMDGMEVFRLEHPVHGDPNRMIGDAVLGEEKMNAYYLCINAGKKGLTLSLAREAGQKLFASLIKKLGIDIFVTNQLPRNYEKLGIDYNSMKAIKNDIIWLGITGFGPDSNEAAYDPILQAKSGLMEMTGERDGEPISLGIPLPDMGTSEHAYSLIMKALFKREATGKGSRLDISMFESSVSWLTVPLTFAKSFNKEITRRGNTHSFFAPVSVYETSDGFVYLAVGNDRQWKSVTALREFRSLDRPEYEKNSGRINDVKTLNKAINSITKRFSSGRLIEVFRSITVPISKINTIKEVAEEELVKERMLSSTDPVTGKKIFMPPPPVRTEYLEKKGNSLSFPPRFGEHNREIYRTLGYSDEDLGRLKEKGIIT